jgi:glycosyltransferase involved in cell wall biosynthesis
MEDTGLIILMPVFNDWPACRKLLDDLDLVLESQRLTANILLVDDGSTSGPQPEFAAASYCCLSRVDMLRLRRNVGHQRAIGTGLAYIEAHLQCDAVVVMDSDGEDAPADVPRLLARSCEGDDECIVFAERTKRCEGMLFQIFYLLYRALHRVLTGHRVRVGNFSVIPRARLKSLVVVPELWSHYAAAVFVSRLPYCAVPTERAERLAGKSSMNFVGLVTHGLTAISVFSGVVGVRLLLAATLLAALSLLGIVSVVGVRLFTPLAIPGWATYSFGLLLVILLQTILSAIIFSFIILSSRNSAAFLPARDFSFYVDRLIPLVEQQEP